MLRAQSLMMGLTYTHNVVGTLPKGYTRGASLPKVPAYRAQKQPLRKKQVHLQMTVISRIGAHLAAARCAPPRGSYPSQ